MSAGRRTRAVDAAAERTAAAIVADYEARTPASAAAFERAARVLVGGVSGSLRWFAPYPLSFARGDGVRVTDVDGTSYVDCFLGNGPLLLGHRPEAVLAAIREQVGHGSLIVNPPLSTSVAERVQRLVPCAERVRFLNSGTEAVLTALRCARAATGRGKVVKFLGHYHGQDDQMLVGLGRSRRPLGSGVSAAAIRDTVVVPFGDVAALAAALAAEPDVAAVILDPAMHNGGLWGSGADYLRSVRDLAHAHGALLIFDEVITGFRLAAGGAQEALGVVPDLATFGKALAAGEKLAAVAGRADIMEVLDPRTRAGRPVAFQSGTANDGSSALAAADAALAEYERLAGRGGYAALECRSAGLADGLRDAFSAHDVPCHVNRLGSMLQLFLTDAEPSFGTYAGLDMRPVTLFCLALLAEGVLLTLPGANHIYLSFAHREDDIDEVVAAAHRVLDRYDFRALVRAAS